jgi:hypothetical protein
MIREICVYKNHFIKFSNAKIKKVSLYICVTLKHLFFEKSKQPKKKTQTKTDS